MSALRQPVRVIAHRGSNEDEPEHTLAAYRRAIAEGADAVECDVRLTADGTLVCVHDRRVDRTSNGRGSVSGMTFDELESLDFSQHESGWRRHPEHANDPARQRVLTLRELLISLLAFDDRIGIAIETKHPTRYGSHVEMALAQLLHEFDLTSSSERVQLMSFSWMAVKRFARLMPDLPRVFLVERLFPGIRDGRMPPGTSSVGLSLRTLKRDGTYAERVLERGTELQVWTVDDPSDAQWCANLGAQAIISNRPAAARAGLLRSFDES